MKHRKYKLKYVNSKTCIELKGYSKSNDIVGLVYQGAEENLSGFIIYDQDGGVVADCSDFKYRWDVLEDDSDRIYYTNSADNVQTEKFHTEDQIEEAEPLTNEELTEAVADLMYEVSMMQLGL